MTDKLSQTYVIIFFKYEIIGTKKKLFNSIGSGFGFYNHKTRVPEKIWFQDFQRVSVLKLIIFGTITFFDGI